LSKRVTIGKVAGLVGVTAFAAAILVVTGGLLLFPAQIPRDSDWDQVLLWLFLASTIVVAVFAAIAVLSALVARRLR
jgi:hypothetical protein